MRDPRDDFELLDAWRAGDRTAGNVLFRRHFGAVCRFFRNKVSHGVDDLIQRTFLACVEHRDAFRGESSFRTYLFTIACNELFTYLRRRRPTVPFNSQHASAAEFDPSPTHGLARKQEQKLLLRALRALPLDLQIALELYYWEELSAAEIGRVLEIPEGTVRGRIRRAKTLLRSRLESMAPFEVLFESTVERIEDWARSLRACIDDEIARR